MWLGIGFHKGDVHQAKDLVQWCGQLDKHIPHGCLLVADAGVDWADAFDLVRLAGSVFERVELTGTEITVGSWPAGANYLFREAAQWFERKIIGPWFWCEPDCIPIKAGWIDALEAEYAACKTRFVGCLTPSLGFADTTNYLPGCSLYPHNAWSIMSAAWDEAKAFDIATSKATVPLTATTKLIQHFWGKGFSENRMAPTFKDKSGPDDPINTFTMAKVWPEAVVFHANKDGTLMKLLGYRSTAQIAIDVVLPVHAGDAALMLKNLRWMNALHAKKQANAVLLCETSVSQERNLIAAANACFANVTVHRYSSRASGWPNGPNCAFQEACKAMSGGHKSWFFMEADAVAIAPDWLEQISDDYIRGGKPFGGTVIDCMGHHLNGVAIYPPNVQHYCKSLPRITEAFDVALNHEIMPHRHRMNHLIQHLIGPPSFASQPDLRVINPTTVIFHPDKSGQLIDRLAERL